MVSLFLRILNAFAHVIDEQQPGPPQLKTTLPSLPTAPSLSPIKRKAKGEKDTGSAASAQGQDSKNAPKTAPKGEKLFRHTCIFYIFAQILKHLFMKS